MLPQVALGHSQSFILNSIYFENEVLHLSQIMIPPISTNTISGEDILGTGDKSKGSNNQNKTEEENKGGRPEKDNDKKSEKTI